MAVSPTANRRTVGVEDHSPEVGGQAGWPDSVPIHRTAVGSSPPCSTVMWMSARTRVDWKWAR